MKTSALPLILLALASACGSAAPVHVWEKVEITLHAKQAFGNPFTDGQVWKKYHPWPESYVRFAQHVFCR